METFHEIMKSANSIVIIAALPADLDSIGSALSMREYLIRQGYSTVHAIIPTTYTPKYLKEFSFLPLITHLEWTNDIVGTLTSHHPDVLIMVDGANMVQFFPKGGDISSIPNRILIDHHLNEPEHIATMTFHDPSAACTSQILFEQLIEKENITSDMATLGYAGIVGDTGNFLWNFTDRTLAIATLLAQKGAATMGILDSIYYSRDKKYFEDLVWVINHVIYDDTLHTIFLYIPQELHIDNEQFNKIKEIFFSNMAKYIESYPRGIIIRAIDTKAVYISVRAHEKRNVINIPTILHKIGGNGGGHFHAASATVPKTFEEAKAAMHTLLADALIQNT